MRVSVGRGHLRWRRLAAGSLVALLLLPATALAADIFGDVSSSNPFYQDIQSLAGAGITTGCGGGNFCPDTNLTRAQETAFLHRGLPRVAMSNTVTNSTFSSATGQQEVGAVALTVGGSNALGIGANQFVKVDAAFTLYGNGTAAGCPCNYRVDLVPDAGGSVILGFGRVESDTSTQRTVTGTYVFPATPGTHTYHLLLNITAPSGSLTAGYLNLVAETATFGNAGTDTLGPAAVKQPASTSTQAGK